MICVHFIYSSAEFHLSEIAGRKRRNGQRRDFSFEHCLDLKYHSMLVVFPFCCFCFFFLCFENLKIVILCSANLIMSFLLQADLKVVNDAKGGSFYRDHLPLLGETLKYFNWFKIVKIEFVIKVINMIMGVSLLQYLY